jgi:predicted transport protein
MIFKTTETGQMKRIEHIPFGLEAELHDLLDNNLEEVFGLQFIKKQATITNKRFDVLAFDKKEKAFCILEYKKDKSGTLGDQLLQYINIVKDNRADCVLIYNENMPTPITKDSVDWDKTRAIAVAPCYLNDYSYIRITEGSVDFWEIRKYSSDIIKLKRVFHKGKNNKYDRTLDRSKTRKYTMKVPELPVEVSDKEYSEDTLLSKSSDDLKELYGMLRSEIIDLGHNYDGIVIKPLKKYVSFKNAKTNKSTIDVTIHSDHINVHMNMKKGTMSDPDNRLRDVSEVGKYGLGDYRLQLKSGDVIDKEVIGFIIQVMEYHKQYDNPLIKYADSGIT